MNGDMEEVLLLLSNGNSAASSIPPHAGAHAEWARVMKEEQFNAIMFHLRAMLGLVCLQAGILVGFAWKYL